MTLSPANTLGQHWDAGENQEAEQEPGGDREGGGHCLQESPGSVTWDHGKSTIYKSRAHFAWLNTRQSSVLLGDMK